MHDISPRSQLADQNLRTPCATGKKEEGQGVLQTDNEGQGRGAGREERTNCVAARGQGKRV